MSNPVLYLLTLRARLSNWKNRRLDYFTPPHTRGLAAGLLAAFAIVVVISAQAEAQSTFVDKTVDAVATGIFVVLNNILIAVIQTLGQITSLIVSLLVAIAQFNKFTTINVVDVGWTIVKDVSNMLFIIALLVISAGTVLRLENYRYNRLLSNLIIMAFLTNFSKFIAGFFIQGAQVIMLTFVNAFRESLFGNFTAMFGLDNILRFSETTSRGLEGATVFVNLLAGLILVVIATVVTAAILVVLVARIVALWILVILSPLAYATRILPNTRSFATRWWSEFGKYVTQGPILAFFLWLALAIVGVGNGAERLDGSFAEIAQETPKADFFAIAAFNFENLVTFVISAAFLLFGLNYATSSSGVAGKWAGKVATAGFGAAATVSGINALRDRTIAPVQGWIRNRGSARQAAIQERTQTLEARGDRIRAAMPNVGVENIPGLRRVPGLRAINPLSNKDRNKAEAAAGIYEQQRTQRVAQSQGMAQWSPTRLQEEVQRSLDPRQRLAALQMLQQQGKYVMSDPDQRQAFEEVIAQQRIPPNDRKKLRDEMITTYAKGLNEDEARREYAQAVAADNKIDRIVYAQRLQEVNALRSEKDDGIVKKLRSDLGDSPERLRAYDALLMRTNPDTAKRVLFNNLGDNTDPNADKNSHRRDFLLAIQQKAMSASAITDDVQQKFVDAADRGTGEKGAIAKFLLENSPDEASLRDLTRGINAEVLEKISGEGDLTGETSDTKRKAWARVTGRWHKAFVGSADASLTKAEERLADESKKRQEYMGKIGGDEISKTMAASELENKDLVYDLYKADNVKIIHLINMMNRDKKTRTSFTTGLTSLADSDRVAKVEGDAISVDKEELGRLTGKSGDDLTEQLQLNQFTQTNLALASRGKELRYDKSNALGHRALTGLMRDSRAMDLNKINESKLYEAAKDEIAGLYGISAKPGEVAEMLLENVEFAEQSIEQAKKKLIADGNKKGNDDKTVELRNKSRNRLKEMARNPTLSYYIGVPKWDDSDDTTNIGGAFAAGAAGGAGRGDGGSKPGKKEGGPNKEKPEDKGPDEEPPEPPPAPGPTAPPSPSTPPPPQNPAGESRAARDARRARPASPRSRIVVPGSADFPTKEERSIDPRIARLTAEQRAIRDRVVSYGNKVANKEPVTDDEYDAITLALKTILSQPEQLEFRALMKAQQRGTKLTASERSRLEDLMIRTGVTSPVYEAPGKNRARMNNQQRPNPEPGETREADYEIVEPRQLPPTP